MSTMYKRCKRNCKDKDKDTTEHKKSPGVNTLDYIKQHKINEIESLIYHIESALFQIKNNYIFSIHNVPYNHKFPSKQFQNMKHEMETYNHQLKFLEYCKRMNYDYVSDIPELVDKYYPIHSML
jgi:uncharacterized lipoprotein YddW (UPF0748 family)